MLFPRNVTGIRHGEEKLRLAFGCGRAYLEGQHIRLPDSTLRTGLYP
jgi:hypothetical protein